MPEIDYRARCTEMIADCVGDPFDLQDSMVILFGCVCGGSDRVHAGMVKRLRTHVQMYPQHYFGQNLLRFFEEVFEEVCVPPAGGGSS